MLRSIQELGDLKGIRVLVRADLNVPVDSGEVTNPLRIEKALPTFHFLLQKGARVILMSHMSKKPGSLVPVFEYLKKKIPLVFVSDVSGVKTHEAANALKDGQALLLENLRWNAGEEANDIQFARELASLGDIYINEGFPVSHRAHASVVTLPKLLPSYAGFEVFSELACLTPALTPESPSLAIVGGAKFLTKENLIRSLLKKYDKVFVGGAIINDFFAAKGYEVGRSLVSGTDHVKDLLDNSKILLPEEVIVSGPNGTEEKHVRDVSPTDSIFDVAPSAIEKLKPFVEKARIILWNGPMGNFENGFQKGTDAVAKLLAEANGKTIVGGGDTLVSIQNLKLEDKFSCVSTAGGSMLDFLANGTLPGIQAIEQ